MLKDPYILVLRITLFCVAGNILFTSGFMLLRIPPVGPGIPINQILLAADLIALFFLPRVKDGFKNTPAIFLPLVVLWVQATIQLLNGLERGGIWAIRDAANMIDSGFFLVGFLLASDPRFLPIFTLWFRRMLTFATFYIMLYPLQSTLSQYSPVIPSMSGYYAPLFFYYNDPSSIACTAVCQMIVSDYGSRLYRTLLTGLLVMTLLVFVQARLVYLQLGLVILLVLFFKPRRLSNLAIMAMATVTLVALFLLSGIELPGRLGSTFTIDFLFDHFAAIWGGGADDAGTKDAAAGVDLRLAWWVKIENDLTQNFPTWLFGLGYGFPLTSFRGVGEDIVREPHNSFLSIYGRLGAFGVFNFFILQTTVIVTSVRFIFLSKRNCSAEIHGLAIALLCFLGVHILYALVEPGFELSFVAVPYYFIAGSLVALQKRLLLNPRALRQQPMARRVAYPGRNPRSILRRPEAGIIDPLAMRNAPREGGSFGGTQQLPLLPLKSAQIPKPPALRKDN